MPLEMAVDAAEEMAAVVAAEKPPANVDI
jgi:hypothetical protein